VELVVETLKVEEHTLQEAVNVVEKVVAAGNKEETPLANQVLETLKAEVKEKEDEVKQKEIEHSEAVSEV